MGARTAVAESETMLRVALWSGIRCDPRDLRRVYGFRVYGFRGSSARGDDLGIRVSLGSEVTITGFGLVSLSFCGLS